MRRMVWPARYLAGGLAILILWSVLAVLLLHRERFTSTGPLSLHQPPLRSAIPGGPGPDRVLAACFPHRSARGEYHVVGGRVDGRLLYACYQLPAGGAIPMTKVVDENGQQVVDVAIIKRGGAWPWVGMVNSGDDVLWAVLGTALLLLLVGVIYRGDRPAPPPEGAPRWARGPLLWLLLGVPLAGWLALLLLPGAGPARRWWLFRRVALVALGICAAFPALLLEWRVDPPGVAGSLLPLVAYAYGVAAGRHWLAPAAVAGPDAEAAPSPAASSLPVPAGTLTGRELEVLRHLAMGLSNAEIAKALFLSEATVKSHVSRLLTKLGFSNRVQAARYAYEHGLVDIPSARPR
jgi:DNA-binding CsgD family transcriptional regulator